MRKNAGLGSLVLVLASASSTRAGESPPVSAGASAGPEVVVECSVLSEDERASVEARARADLAIKGLAGGVLSVTCSEGMGRVSFQWGELEGAQAGALPDVSRATVETLLQLVDAVTTESERARSEAPLVTPSALPPEPGSTPAPVEPAPPSEAPAAARTAPVPVATPAPAPAAAPASRSSRSGSTNPWHVGVGVEAEMWATEATGAFGLRLRAGRRFALPLVLSGVVAADAASAEPEAVTVRVWRAGLEVAGCASESVCIVLGAQLTRMVADGPVDWSPASHANTSFAGTVRLEYVVDLDPLELAPALGVLLYPARRTVTLNDERVLSVPQLTGSFVLELRWRF